MGDALKVIVAMWVIAQLGSHPRQWKRARKAVRSGLLTVLRRIA